jgi:hypothetical protein
MSKKVMMDMSKGDLKALILARLLKQVSTTDIQGLVSPPAKLAFPEGKAEEAREELIKEFRRRTERLRGKTFFPVGTFK